MDNSYQTPAEAARRLGISTRTLQRAVKRGDLVPARRAPGGSARFRPADVEEYAARLARAAHIPPPVPLTAEAPPTAPHETPTPAVPTGTASPAAPAGPTLPAAAAILENISDAFVALDRAGRVTYLNAAAERLARRPRSDLVGHSLLGSFPGHRAEAPERLRRVMQDGVPWHYETFHAPLGLWLDVSAYPTGEGLCLYVRDVTARKQASEALRASEERYRRIVETTQEGVWQIDTAFTTTFVNQRLAEMLGYRAEELLGQPSLSLLAEQHREAAQARMARRAAGDHTPEQYDIKLRRRDGTELWAAISSSALCDDEGAVLGRLMMVTDITARKAAEDAVLSSERRHRALNESTAETVIVRGDDGIIRYASPSHRSVLGVEPASLIGTTGSSLLHPDDAALAREHSAARITSNDGAGATGRTAAPTVLRVRHGDGSWRWMETHVVDARNDPAIGGFVIRGRDITERRQAEEALRASEERYREAFERAALGMATISLDGRYLEVNAALCAILGYTAQELLARSVHDLVHPDDLTDVERGLAHLREGGIDTYRSERRHRHKDGHIIWVEVHGTVMRDAAGRPLHVVNQIQDITERKQLADLRARLAAIVENSDDAIISTETDGTITSWNGGATRMYGYTAAEVLGRSYSALGLFEPEEGRRFAERLRRGERLADVETVRRRKDGSLVPVSLNVAPILDARGALAGAAAVARDITARKQAEGALRRAAQQNGLLAAAIDHTTIGVVITDPSRADNPVIYVNPAFTAVTGYPVEDVLGRSLRLLQGPETDTATVRSMRRAIQWQQPFSGVLRNYRKDGTAFWNELHLTPVHDDAGAVTHFVGLLTDVSERVRLEGALQHQALHDPLTGLPNRALLGDRLSQAIAAAARGGSPVSLLMLDLDRFKEINDTFGHPHGDAVLREIAGRFPGALRAQDTVARLGGDEFAVVLPADDAAAAQAAVARLQAVLREPFAVEGVSVQPEASIGVAVYPEHGADADTLLRHADVAMYAAKRTGAGCLVYAPTHDIYTAERVALIEELRAAIRAEALLLHYQPKVALDDGTLVGFEALVRWPHPRRGIVPPGQFVPLAEQTGQISALTAAVLAQAIAQIREWERTLGMTASVAVNVSAANLRDGELPAQIARLLAAHQVAPARLRLEVTEGSLMSDPERAVEILARLAEMGIGISVDDYGTGYSSLAYLARLTVDEIKIDQSFVRDMVRHPPHATIVASTIGLGHALGLRVVAEGVEDEATWEALRSLGCDVAQGYHLARPGPAAEAAAWLHLDTDDSRRRA